MFKKVLVPTDGSPLSEKAVAAAVEFAQTTKCELISLCVAEPYIYSALIEGAGIYPVDTTNYDEKAQEYAQHHVDKALSLAQEAGVKCTTTVSLSFSPYEEIIRIAEENNCDAIFMASHGRKGLNKLFIGSETQKVLAHTSIPVMVFR